MKRTIQESAILIRYMLDGKSLKNARIMAGDRNRSIQILQTRKDFYKYGSDLSSYSDEEIERCLVYISRILEQKTEKTSSGQEISLN